MVRHWQPQQSISISHDLLVDPYNIPWPCPSIPTVQCWETRLWFTLKVPFAFHTAIILACLAWWDAKMECPIRTHSSFRRKPQQQLTDATFETCTSAMLLLVKKPKYLVSNLWPRQASEPPPRKSCCRMFHVHVVCREVMIWPLQFKLRISHQ